MEHCNQTIAFLQENLRELEEAVIEQKKAINLLSKITGQGMIYPEADLQQIPRVMNLQADAFYGQALNTSIRRILEMRKEADLGPASVRELYATLVEGGFLFPRAKNEKSAMDSLRISLGKSTHTFHKLPGGKYGLLAWYPSAKVSKQKKDEAENGLSGTLDMEPPPEIEIKTRTQRAIS